jgi:putative ABC transport system permease protein
VFEALFTELRQIVRALRRSPGFVTAVVGPLVLALALTTSIVSVVQTVLMRDLPFTDPERLVLVGEADSGESPQNTGFTTISDLRAQAKTLQALVAMRGWLPTLTSPSVERLSGMRVSSGFFSMLGVTPALGRDFQPADDGPDSRFVVILSHGLWQRAFGGDTGIVNRTIRLNETNYRVIGVLPQTFEPIISSQLFTTAEIWGPLGYALADRSACRGCRHLKALGALAAGSTLDQARDELGALHRSMAAQFPRDYGAGRIKVERLADRIARPFATTLLVLAGAVALVLIIAVANAASLTLTRAADLEHEMGLRAALGASRARLIRHKLLEGLVVAGTAGFWGILLGSALTRWLVANAPDALPRADRIGLHAPVVLVVVGITILVAVAVALAPAIGGSKIAAAIVSRTRSTGSRGLIRVRETLVVADVAVALTLSICAGVMVQSVERLLRVQPGFVAEDVFTTQLSLVGPRWATDEAVRQFQRDVLERVKRLPGVSAAAMTGQVPLGNNYDRRGGYLFERQTGRAEDGVEFERYSISPDYLRVMGIPLLRGRALDDRDGFDKPPVMLVSEEAARRFWPSQDPLGRKVVFDESRPPVTVVGVVGDVRHYRLEDPPEPQMYMPQEQMTDSFLVLTVKGAAFDTQWPAVRAIVHELGPDVPLYSFASMEDLVAQSAASRRFTAFLLGLFALLGTAMTAAGVYGLVAYTVARRTREFGIRVALGASRSEIRRLVLARGLVLTAIGVAAGLVGSRLAGTALGGIRYDTSTFDGVAVLAAVAVLAVAALAAHVAPLSRALGVSPTEALRGD